MRAINLYIFNESSRASVYGIGTYLRELTHSLRESIMNVTVIHLNANKPQVEMEETDHIRHWYFPGAIENTPYLDHASRSRQYYRNVVYLLQVHILDTNQLVFHLNYLQSKPLAEALRETFDCKLVFAIHYFDWSFGLSGNITQFRQILAETDVSQSNNKSIYESYLREKELFETVDHIICLSRNTRQILQEDYKLESQKLSVIYNGLSDYSPHKEKAVLREKYRLRNIPIVLFTGRLDEIKGLRYAIQAFKKVKNTLPHCHMIITGNGSFDTYLKECEEIWTSITFTGLIDKQYLYELYTIADVGIMPSFHEQCSYVAIEMMMHSIPLIASTSTGLHEMVEESVSGLHIPVTEYPDKVEIDPELLAEKILFLLQKPEEKERMGINARKRYEELYTSEIMGETMLELYKNIRYDS